MTAIQSGLGQASNIIVDARGSGLSQDEAMRSLARMRGIGTFTNYSVRIVGDGYNIEATVTYDSSRGINVLKMTVTGSSGTTTYTVPNP